MDRLLELVEELVEAVERRDCAEPDMAGWEAEADIRRLQRLLVLEYHQTAGVWSDAPWSEHLRTQSEERRPVAAAH
jgi:hypothetical protein